MSIVSGKASQIMTKGLIWITPDTSILDATRLMLEKNIGSVVVIDKGEIVGIVTESDFVKAVSRNLDPKETPVRAIMSSPVVTCDPDTPVTEIVRLMKRKGVRHIPIVRGREHLGMVSGRDIIWLKAVDIALLFHSMLFGYYKSVSDVLKTGCTILAPHVVDGIIEIYSKSGVELAKGKVLGEILENAQTMLTEAGIVNKIDIVEEEKDKFRVEVDCPFAYPTHALIRTEDVICPVALLIGAVLKKFTNRQVKIDFSKFMKRGTATTISLL